ncbi:MAG: BlaI/MecI/CopY family transcriptional regulator [Actinomycetota bacterium]|jgi:predicted transcriptional regulator|nr:BlaI/MecI/CopY family transcriptional regulator [Actinomycetota bacterium]
MARNSLSLGSLEAKIMHVVWQEGDVFLSVRDVLGRLDEDLAYTTVMTVMNRLYEKGLLRRRRDGRAWLYRPAMTREAFAAATMSEVLSTASDRRAALLHFVADLSGEDTDALRRLLGRRKST